MNPIQATLDWLNNPSHIAEVGAVGFLLGKAALLLPSNWKYKKPIVNFFHGAFPSWEVATSGVADKQEQKIIQALKVATVFASDTAEKSVTVVAENPVVVETIAKKEEDRPL